MRVAYERLRTAGCLPGEARPREVFLQDRKDQPFTLMRENDRTAVPGRGLPIQVAGRNRE